MIKTMCLVIASYVKQGTIYSTRPLGYINKTVMILG